MEGDNSEIRIFSDNVKTMSECVSGEKFRFSFECKLSGLGFFFFFWRISGNDLGTGAIISYPHY